MPLRQSRRIGRATRDRKSEINFIFRTKDVIKGHIKINFPSIHSLLIHFKFFMMVLSHTRSVICNLLCEYMGFTSADHVETSTSLFPLHTSKVVKLILSLLLTLKIQELFGIKKARKHSEYFKAWISQVQLIQKNLSTTSAAQCAVVTTTEQHGMNFTYKSTANDLLS